jgi:hypothetical protein
MYIDLPLAFSADRRLENTRLLVEPSCHCERSAAISYSSQIASSPRFDGASRNDRRGDVPGSVSLRCQTLF